MSPDIFNSLHGACAGAARQLAAQQCCQQCMCIAQLIASCSVTRHSLAPCDLSSADDMAEKALPGEPWSAMWILPETVPRRRINLQMMVIRNALVRSSSNSCSSVLVYMCTAVGRWENLLHV
jgi:hypothetical protein